MIIVKLQGGLGNQMFQYAAGKTLASKHNVELKFDLSHLLDRSPSLNIVFREYDLDIFPAIKVAFATEAECAALHKKASEKGIIRRALNKVFGNESYFKEKSFRFDPAFNNLGEHVYLDGYWQSEKYFKEAKNIVEQDFQFAPLTIETNLELIKKIEGENSVCLNVRRGDFVNHSGSSAFHGFKGLDYIYNAVRLIEAKLSNLHFYIFSDDIHWCIENIRLEHAVTVIDHTHAGKKFADYLQLMTACQHFIIPNSSFAWWAAWLCKNPNKIVIAPQEWFADASIDTSDLVPKDWMRL